MLVNLIELAWHVSTNKMCLAIKNLIHAILSALKY
jgi:hypothetical protein